MLLQISGMTCLNADILLKPGWLMKLFFGVDIDIRGLLIWDKLLKPELGLAVGLLIGRF